MKNVCLYYGSDLDGQCGGAIYARKHDEGELIFFLCPIDYGDPIPWDLIEGAYVTLIDFSIQPWEDFLRLFKCAGKVEWIDHHRSAIMTYFSKRHTIESDSQPVVILDGEKAACELTWVHFFSEKPTPRAVYLLGRYDVWDHEDSDVLPFQYGMRLLDLDPEDGVDFELWEKWILENDKLSTEEVKRTISVGKHLLKYRAGQNAIAVDGNWLLEYQAVQDAIVVDGNWFPLDFAGYKWQVCNQIAKGSRFFESVRDIKNYHGVMFFSFDGEKWTVNLYRDRANVDCGAIAKDYGGGGYPDAAGFQCFELPFDLITKEQINDNRSNKALKRSS